MQRVDIHFDKRRCLRGNLQLLRRTNGAFIYTFQTSGLSLGSWLPWTVLRLLPLEMRMPNTIVIKQYDSLDGGSREDLAAFAQERAAFESMGLIQGDGVPYWYGQVKIEDGEALAVAKQYLRGESLHRLATTPSHPSAQELCSGIVHCYDQISTCGVLQLDAEPGRLDDLMLVTQTRTAAVIGVVFIGVVVVLFAPRSGLKLLTIFIYVRASFAVNESI